MNLKPPIQRSRIQRVQTATLNIKRTQSANKGPMRQKSLSKGDLTKLGLPYFSAQCMLIINASNGKEIIVKYYIFKPFEGYQQNKRVQIASITKLMTCYLCVSLCKEFEINLNEYFFVTYEAVDIGGTMAFLRAGDQIRIIDLLYALMLPSGNDAALVIAENLSIVLKEFSSQLNIQYRIQPFIQQMNIQAQLFGMSDTKFMNPHGLHNEFCYSTAQDVAKLCFEIYKEPLIREIASTSEYEAVMKRQGQFERIVWYNTNKLLTQQGFYGIKTGVTIKAGPCLTSYYQDEKHKLIIVLLNCLSNDIRWRETMNLVNWVKQ
ncbi:hypothetical protein pb186bvf_008371 [Paramecium bursaria]